MLIMIAPFGSAFKARICRRNVGLPTLRSFRRATTSTAPHRSLHTTTNHETPTNIIPPPPPPNNNKVALIMGVANQRSIAWSCVKAFLEQNYNVIVTHQDRFQDKVRSLVDAQDDPRILGHVNCNVQMDLPRLFAQDLPQILDQQYHQPQKEPPTMHIHAMVHCIAYGDLQQSLRHVDWETYREAQHISAFSALETAQCATLSARHLLAPGGASLTTLSYLGAARALQPYGVMGPAKAALEALVRGMALEFGRPDATTKQESNNDETTTTFPHPPLRVNAVSAGPIATLSARGGIADFAALQQMTSQTSPLGRPVTAQEVAETIVWVANSPAITGQTIYVDGGFSSIVPILPSATTTTR